MAVRNDFAAGEVLAAADLNDTFASKLPYSYGTATPSTTDSGFLWYDSNSSPAAPKFWDGAAFQAIGGGGAIVQIVRATDGTDRTTTSSSYVDASISVTITPTQSANAILLVWSANVATIRAGSFSQGYFQITDNSNNPISGAEDARIKAQGTTLSNVELIVPLLVIAYATPATTSAVTYKGRFAAGGLSMTTTIYNSSHNTGQLYAIEVAP